MEGRRKESRAGFKGRGLMGTQLALRMRSFRCLFYYIMLQDIVSNMLTCFENFVQTVNLMIIVVTTNSYFTNGYRKLLEMKDCFSLTAVIMRAIMGV